MRVLLGVSLAALLGLSACNTARGVGQDVQSAGKSISQTATEVQNDL